jgi:prepilin-type N-terminal cleavage/methylation domain-containing protein/prepilin-type processing-associated H-X9-DG protein
MIDSATNRNTCTWNVSHARCGFSLIEVLVCVGIIGLLVSLTLPAVQAAREAARRAQCTNNLKQLTAATASFTTAWGGVPGVSGPRHPGSVPGRHYAGPFSAHVRLLPYLELSHLHDSINFDFPCAYADDLPLYHATAAAQTVAVFLCPSDPQPGARTFGPNSYRSNIGVNSVQERDGVQYPTFEGGFVFSSRVVPIATYTDGLSSTLAFSEKPTGSGTGGDYTPFRDWVPKMGVSIGDGNYDADAWMRACSRLSGSVDGRLDAGLTWMISDITYTHFNAATAPNSRIPDCGYYGSIGAFAARSYHPGGVNASMFDGSVRWFKSSIDLKIWRSLATRAGGEAVSLHEL